MRRSQARKLAPRSLERADGAQRREEGALGGVLGVVMVTQLEERVGVDEIHVAAGRATSNAGGIRLGGGDRRQVGIGDRRRARARIAGGVRRSRDRHRLAHAEHLAMRRAPSDRHRSRAAALPSSPMPVTRPSSSRIPLPTRTAPAVQPGRGAVAHPAAMPRLESAARHGRASPRYASRSADPVDRRHPRGRTARSARPRSRPACRQRGQLTFTPVPITAFPSRARRPPSRPGSRRACGRCRRRGRSAT